MYCTCSCIALTVCGHSLANLYSYSTLNIYHHQLVNWVVRERALVIPPPHFRVIKVIMSYLPKQLEVLWPLQFKHVHEVNVLHM